MAKSFGRRDDEEQEDRFYDKDWETEWVIPSLICEYNNESSELQYYNGLFTLEIFQFPIS